MSPRIMVLRAIEQKIEALFEGVFGRAFRTNVQPVELARKLSKEMDDHKTVSVSRVYVPNEYTVYLSPSDREQFEGYIGEHARRESYALLTPPKVLLETDADLAVGEFGIATRMVQPKRAHRAPDEPEDQVESGATMIYKPAKPAPAAAPGGELGLEREVAVLSWDGQTRRIDKRRVVLGRSRECDIQVEDANVSRRHAELRQEGAGYLIVAGTTYQTVLLALKVAFLVLLYLFIWRIVRTAGRDLRLPQESFIMRPALAGGAIGRPVNPGRLVVVHSEILSVGEEFELDSTALTVGRGGRNDVSIEGDEFASARHVRVEPRRDGVWVSDLGSTNGTFVNGVRVDRARKLVPGDVVRVGETELRFEE